VTLRGQRFRSRLAQGLSWQQLGPFFLSTTGVAPCPIFEALWRCRLGYVETPATVATVGGAFAGRRAIRRAGNTATVDMGHDPFP
jgi:hypothetical protein